MLSLLPIAQVLFSVLVPLQFRLLCVQKWADRVLMTVSPSLWQLDHCSHDVQAIAGVVDKVTVVVGNVTVVVNDVVVLGRGELDSSEQQ